ncbi:MAG: phosphate acyltransferase PlsX [bacterium]|nr:phosphate acyltransferase PlsX [bacterium]MDE0287201.1 phosphate acyltransferase PlsX [bacterium]MDE0437144.1 phosphate acyltransferase PlsX [bacterium]
MARIAVDVMGTDQGPAEIVAGAVLAAEAGHDVVLVGREEVVEPDLNAIGADLPVVHAPEVVEMHDHPAKAVRDKPDSSVLTAARLVASHGADALVSAGSTGAAIAAASIVIGRIKGVLRPAIATPIPRPGKPVLLLDAGANLEVRPVHLLQFGVMGAQLAEIVYGIERPRVGLLNIGAERAKGRDVERSAFELLEEAPVNFVGNLEGGDIIGEVADVFVTDGFTGNVALKTIEAAAGLVARLIGRAFERLPEEVLPHIAAPMNEIREVIDPARYGGAHLVGTSASVVICHGSSSRRAIFNAIRLATEGVKGGLIERLEHGLVRS